MKFYPKLRYNVICFQKLSAAEAAGHWQLPLLLLLDSQHAAVTEQTERRKQEAKEVPQGCLQTLFILYARTQQTVIKWPLHVLLLLIF